MEPAYISEYWTKRMEQCRKALEANSFEVFVSENPAAARETVLKEILPKIEVKSFSWGDSMTLHATGLLDVLQQRKEMKVIITFDKNVPREELMEPRRQALLTDLFLTGTNALTQSGQLINLDMVGNRTAAITFGPKHVILFVGRNKIVTDLAEGMKRIKTCAAPLNAMRHEFKTPCAKNAQCTDCKSPQRICNTWTITEKSWPKGRIKIILINEDLGL